MRISPEDLDLAPIEDLQAALARRFDGYVFLGVKELDGQQRGIHRGFAGDTMVMVGYLAQMINDICAKHIDTAREPAE